jgi:hypothetical protein
LSSGYATASCSPVHPRPADSSDSALRGQAGLVRQLAGGPGSLKSVRRARGQLGSSKLDVRIGGIYALERIARDSRRNYPAVIEVQVAFTRERSRDQWLPINKNNDTSERATRPDVQAAVTVIGRRHSRYDPLRNGLVCDLHGANLADANLALGNFSVATLYNADLKAAGDGSGPGFNGSLHVVGQVTGPPTGPASRPSSPRCSMSQAWPGSSRRGLAQRQGRRRGGVPQHQTPASPDHWSGRRNLGSLGGGPHHPDGPHRRRNRPQSGRSQVLNSKIAQFVAVVVGLAFLLLAVVFRPCTSRWWHRS